MRLHVAFSNFNNCSSVLLLVIVTRLLVIVKAESYEQQRPVESSSQIARESLQSHTNTSHVHPNSTLSSDQRSDHARVPIKLKKCKDSAVTSREVQIPTYYASEYAYVEAPYEIGETLGRCATGQKPNSPEIFSVSLKTFESYFDDVNEIFRQLRNDVFLFDSGYLSVGLNDTAWYYSPDEFCVANIRKIDSDTIVEFRTCDFDMSRPLYPKCCPFGMALDANFTSCEAPNVGGPDFLDKKTGKLIKFKDVNPIYTSPKINCSEETWEFDNCTIVFYPATDNSVAFVGAHRTWEYLKSDVTKCFDYKVLEDGTKQPVVIHCTNNSTARRDKESQTRISTIYMVMMYIGAGFHLLTTLVYLVTWPKQNIHGKTLCSCTASLFFMQIFLGTAHLLGLGGFGNQRDSPFCFINSVGGQYFMIAAFTWLLVVNIDLWRTFRSIRTDGRSSLKRFLSYSGLGWGFPLLVSAISIALEYTFTCRASGVPIPEFGEHYCFVSPWAQGYYVYYILSFLIALSFVFAALTLFGLYSFKKDTSNLRSSKRAADRQNILLFLKLGVVMGLTWIFEVISWAATKEEHDNSIIWILIDLYNALSAILIFIIFVCKRTTLNLLEQTVPFLTGLSAAVSKFTSTFTGDPTSDNTNSTGVPGINSTTSKKSIELHSFRKDEGSTNSGFQ